MTTFFCSLRAGAARLVRGGCERQDARRLATSSPCGCAASTSPNTRPRGHGDHIIVLNAGRSASRATSSRTRSTTGTPAPSRIKSKSLEKMLAEHPERAIEFAVKGMLPKNPLGRAMFKKLHVFDGEKHRTPRSSPSRSTSEPRVPTMPANTSYGTGRRKTSTARVHLRPAPARSASTTGRSRSSSVARRRA